MVLPRGSTEKVDQLAGLPAHNASAQHDVKRNPDHALDVAHEHQHEHLHHSGAAAREADVGVAYTVGTSDGTQKVTPAATSPDNHHHHHHHPETTEKNMYEIAVGDKQHQLSSDSSLEHGERDAKNHKFSRFYRKYKPFFHAFIWILFTGYVTIDHQSPNRKANRITVGGLLVSLYTMPILGG